ncbi:VTC domain-containing protein, partial [Candidatus Falkowbacteria bacterium]|nr:VTC domain-containing protein [Candidatus Falkowbacteria bacterium]
DKDNDFLRELVWFKRRNAMRPKLFVSYKRKALVGKIDRKFRVTFDYDIKTQLAKDLNISYDKLKNVYPQGVVLELKFNNVLPTWFHKIIQRYQLQRLAYSKYCNSLRMAMPQFDDNNYSISKI